ncbi:unnamed protein product [Paramecium pentaurelia]|uniref:Uncharacterized protein n=1 Tax=Paramecium pentaurelia TaxID=43138 RepID=A0A8S1VBX1_9CILI|nr:unnamed protein product [Paramecium pentaurelia]
MQLTKNFMIYIRHEKFSRFHHINWKQEDRVYDSCLGGDLIEKQYKILFGYNHQRKYYAEERLTYFNKDDTHKLQLLNSFVSKEPYENHFWIVFEILDVNPLDLIK